MSTIWGIPSPFKSEAQNHLFGRLRNLTANLTAYILGTTHDMDNRSRGPLHRLKMSWTLVHKRPHTGPPFYPPCVNSVFYVIARLRGRRLANRTKPNIAKRRMVNHANNLTQEKWGPRNFCICTVFRRLRHLMANIFWKKRTTDNRERCKKVQGASYIVWKFRQLWSTNGLK